MLMIRFRGQKRECQGCNAVCLQPLDAAAVQTATCSYPANASLSCLGAVLGCLATMHIAHWLYVPGLSLALYLGSLTPWQQHM